MLQSLLSCFRPAAGNSHVSRLSLDGLTETKIEIGRLFCRCIREYGLHTIDLQTLSGEVGDVRVLKMKSRLVVTLVKGGRGSYSKKTPWEKLQSPPEKRSKDD